MRYNSIYRKRKGLRITRPKHELFELSDECTVHLTLVRITSLVQYSIVTVLACNIYRICLFCLFVSLHTLSISAITLYLGCPPGVPLPLDPQYFHRLWSATLPAHGGWWVPVTSVTERVCLAALGGTGGVPGGELGGVSASPVAVSSSGGSSSGSGPPPPLHPPANEIDRIMAKIDQDNRILAELDKTRSTIGN